MGAYKLMLGAREEEVSPSFPAPPPPPSSSPAPVAASDEPQAKRRKQDGSAEVLKARIVELTKVAAKVFAEENVQEMLRGELFERVNAKLMGGEDPFSEAEFDAGLKTMEDENKVFVNPESGDVTLLA